jgi:hypothetical protein
VRSVEKYAETYSNQEGKEVVESSLKNLEEGIGKG